MITIEEAFKLLETTVEPFTNEIVDLKQSVGRVLAKPVCADVDSPPHTKSIMDGFAVRSKDISPGVQLKILETIIAGDVPRAPLSEGTCSRIMTGAPLPVGADAIIMVEQSTQIDESVTFEIDSIESGKHVIQKAASFSCGETIFSEGHQIRPIDIGLLAEIGAHQISVARHINASVLPTGNELVAADQKPGPGQIRNSNGPMILSLLANDNANTNDLGIGRDEKEDLRIKIANGLQSDILILSGGVSAGTMDLVPEVLTELGVEQIFHKVKVKPGKPIWFGIKKNETGNTYVFGLPGNPVSSLVGYQLFVRATIDRLCGKSINRSFIHAELTEDHQARGDRPTYWPAQWVDDSSTKRLIRPLSWLGSSDLRALGSANALVFFPSDRNSYHAGETVGVLPFGK